MTRKRVVSALVAVPALFVLLAATRPWLTGRSTDPLLGGGAVSATGSQLAPGVVSLAAVALVALVATLTSGPRLRRVGAVVLLLAAVGAVALTVRPLLEPEGALGRLAASGLGRTGEVRTTATVTAWAWVALAAGVLLSFASLVTLVAAGRWTGLSSRFEAPGSAASPQSAASPESLESHSSAHPAATSEGRTERNAWDAISDGDDPTVGPGARDEQRRT